jgi:radical SAM enzyme (TIGR01210 family)
MNSAIFTQQVLNASRAAGKTYSFNDSHDENTPMEKWFQESNEGTILFIVFYSLACRWSRCLGCNLPSKMSSRLIKFKALMNQIDGVFSDPEVVRKKDSIKKVIVSNNGSILDEDTYSSTALIYLLAQLNGNLPNLKILSIESRPEYVDLAELEFMSRALAEHEPPVNLEIAIGLEAFDDRIRNDVFHKGLPLKALDSLMEKMAPFGFRLKVYFMQKPVPGMTDAEAVTDVKNAIEYLSQSSDQHRVGVNMHLNPTYVAAGTMLEAAFRKGEYVPPKLIDVAAAARHARGKSVSIFIGLSDEGLSVKGGSFLRDGDKPILDELERFNRTQDFSILDKVCGNAAMQQ